MQKNIHRQNEFFLVSLFSYLPGRVLSLEIFTFANNPYNMQDLCRDGSIYPKPKPFRFKNSILGPTKYCLRATRWYWYVIYWPFILWIFPFELVNHSDFWIKWIFRGTIRRKHCWTCQINDNCLIHFLELESVDIHLNENIQ